MADNVCTAADAKRAARIMERWGVLREIVEKDPRSPVNEYWRIGDLDAIPDERKAEFCVQDGGELIPIASMFSTMNRFTDEERQVAAFFGHLGLATENMGGPYSVQKAKAAWKAEIRKALQ